jgi:hypothetical protein
MEPADPFALGRYREPTSDPKTAPGIALVGMGALAMAGGIVVSADGASGCAVNVLTSSGSFCQTPDRGLEGAGLGLIVGGAAAAAFGGAMWWTGTLDEPPYPHRSTSTAGAGVFLTGFAFAATLGGGATFLYGAAVEGAGSALAGGAVTMLGGGISFAVGAPLFFRGLGPPSDPRLRRESRADGPLVRASPALATGGLLLTTAGATALVTGFVGGGILASSSRTDGGGIGVITAFSLAGGTMLGIGIPMLVRGARRVGLSDAYASRDFGPPEIDVGLGSLSLRWHY